MRSGAYPAGGKTPYLPVNVPIIFLVGRLTLHGRWGLRAARPYVWVRVDVERGFHAACSARCAGLLRSRRPQKLSGKNGHLNDVLRRLPIGRWSSINIRLDGRALRHQSSRVISLASSLRPIAMNGFSNMCQQAAAVNVVAVSVNAAIASGDSSNDFSMTRKGRCQRYSP